MEEATGIADEQLDENRLDLCNDLADWAVTNNQTHKSLNDLLQILRQARCNSEYIYYGLETGICSTLLQCRASTEHIDICINVFLPCFSWSLFYVGFLFCYVFVPLEWLG